MFPNLAVGSALVALSVLIHTVGLILIARVTPVVARRLGLHNHGAGRTLVMTATVLGILAILTVEVWVWAIGYLWLGAVSGFADALSLSTAMFSTIGYGATSFNAHWGLLTSLSRERSIFDGLSGPNLEHLSSI